MNRLNASERGRCRCSTTSAASGPASGGSAGRSTGPCGESVALVMGPIIPPVGGDLRTRRHASGAGGNGGDMTSEGLTYTWIGNATAVLRLGAFAVLTDPNFIGRGQRAYLGKGLWSRRLKGPAMGVGELPPLDAVVLSHLHGDHFDRVARRGLDRRPPLLTTPAAARRLRRYGFDTHGMNTWERVEFSRDGERLAVEALPGVHAFGAMGRLLPPVMGSLLEHTAADGATTRVYVTGDTLPGGHLDEIARRHPDVDAAVVHLGGTRVLAHTVT